MLVIMGTVRIDPERTAGALPAMRRMVAASNAEDGCELYAYSQDLVDPGLVRISECWRDRAALKAHSESPHMAEWRGVVPGLGVSERILTLYEVSGSEPL